jgi:hypothetical protein
MCDGLSLLMMDGPKPLDVDIVYGMTGRGKCRMRDIVDLKEMGESEDRDFRCMNRQMLFCWCLAVLCGQLRLNRAITC